MSYQTHLPPPNSRTLIIGRSKKGKTSLIINMIRFHFVSVVDFIIIMSPTFHFDNKWKTIKRLGLPLKLYEIFTLQTMTEIYNFLLQQRREHQRTLLVIDDMTREVRTGGRAEFLLDRIIANNRWLLTTVIESVQKVIHAPPEMRLNWDCLITFYPDNLEEFGIIYKTCGFGDKRKFDSLLRYCTREPYSFLYIRRDGPQTSYFRRFTPLTVWDGKVQIN